MLTWLLATVAAVLVLLGLGCLFRTQGADRYEFGAVAFLSTGIWSLLVAGATAMAS